MMENSWPTMHSAHKYFDHPASFDAVKVFITAWTFLTPVCHCCSKSCGAWVSKQTGVDSLCVLCVYVGVWLVACVPVRWCLEVYFPMTTHSDKPRPLQWALLILCTCHSLVQPEYEHWICALDTGRSQTVILLRLCWLQRSFKLTEKM